MKHFALALLVAALPNVGRASARPSVDLDVKDEDVVVILKSMQKQCGIKNLVIDKEVQGKGTFIFRDLPCERAFDTGHFLRSLLPVDLDRSSVGRLVSRVAGELDLDAEHVRSWAFVRSVEDALWGLNVGRTDVGWDLDRARALA